MPAWPTQCTSGARRLDVWAYNDAGAGERIATDLGFAPARRLLHLHRHMTDTPPEASLDAFTLRTFRPGVDDRAWLALNNRIFAGHGENGAWAEADLRARIAQPWFDERDFLLLESQGEVAGFCWMKMIDTGDGLRSGEIYIIGLAPETRGRGLGRKLLDRALTHLRERGAGIAAIYVDEANEAAVELYRSNGFHHHHVDVCYTRDLVARPAAHTQPEEAAA